MFGIFEVFADTIVICTLTAMVILCSGTAVNYGTAAGAELTISGFTTTYGGWASIFTAVALCCFAFSTIIGWGLYGSRFLVFLCRSDKVAKPFFLVYSFVSILGATMDLGLLWSIADTFNGLMSIPNLLALLLLSGTVVRLTKEFLHRRADCPQQKEAVARQLSKTLYETRNFFRAKTAPKGSGSLILRNFPAQAATAFFNPLILPASGSFQPGQFMLQYTLEIKMNRGNEPWIFMVPSARPAHSRRSCSTWWKPA